MSARVKGTITLEQPWQSGKWENHVGTIVGLEGKEVKVRFGIKSQNVPAKYLEPIPPAGADDLVAVLCGENVGTMGTVAALNDNCMVHTADSAILHIPKVYIGTRKK